MAVTGTKTVQDIVTQALRKAGIVAFGETPAADDAQAAREELEAMLKSWQSQGWSLWYVTSGSLDLNVTPATSYTLSPARPLQILSARYDNGTSELPMTEMTRAEYDELPIKTTTGIPTQFYYDRQREAAKLYVWPILTAAAAVTIEYTYIREAEDVPNLTDTIDVPGEWWDVVVYNLAARIADTVMLPNTSPNLSGRAQMLLDDALAFDREGSVHFCRDAG